MKKLSLNVTFSNSLCERFDFVEIGQSPVLVPAKCSDELKHRLLAAYVSYHMDLKSMDRVLRLYKKDWELKSDIPGVVDGLTNDEISWCL